MCYQQGWHAGFIHADADAVARHARLCNFEYSISNAVSITNADLIIVKAFNCEVFSELSETKITAAQKVFPVMIGIHLVDEYGALLFTVTSEIGLSITIDIQLARHSSSLNRRLPDRRSHSLAVPCDVA